MATQIIGSRTATRDALGGAVGALAAWPGVALLLLLLWSVVARATDRTVTGLVLRRYENGRRRSDVPWAVGLSPWHVVLSAVATVVGLVLPLAVALAACRCATPTISTARSCGRTVTS